MPKSGSKASLFAQNDSLNSYIKYDGITDFIYKKCNEKYKITISKDDIYYYVYGILNSEDYKNSFSGDLKKSLPRIPLVDDADDFLAFSRAGRGLADLHLGYEKAKPYDGATITGLDKGDFRVVKMRFAGKGGKSDILFNDSIRISGIPPEAFGYVVGGRPAVEWVMDRYQVRVDKDSGLVNDPNDWAAESGRPGYILDLLLGVVTVSLETIRIVKGLPRLEF
jgi:predicted helicase